MMELAHTAEKEGRHNEDELNLCNLLTGSDFSDE